MFGLEACSYSKQIWVFSLLSLYGPSKLRFWAAVGTQNKWVCLDMKGIKVYVTLMWPLNCEFCI